MGGSFNCVSNFVKHRSWKVPPPPRWKEKEERIWKGNGNLKSEAYGKKEETKAWIVSRKKILADLGRELYSFRTGKALQNLLPTHHMATKIKEYLQIVLEKERLQKTVSTVNSGPFLNCRGRAALQEQLGWLWLFSWSGCRWACSWSDVRPCRRRLSSMHGALPDQPSYHLQHNQVPATRCFNMVQKWKGTPSQI